MNKWKYPSSYAGETYYEYYEFLGQHRDSDLLEQSNFACALAELGGESETVIIARASHWAVGWVETLLIHQSDTKAIAIAESMENALADYPVLDDEDFSEREWDYACTSWQQMDIRERVNLCQEHSVNIFAARHDDMPQDDNGSLFENLRTA